MQWSPLQIRLVNATVLDNAIRSGALHNATPATTKTIDKANSDIMVNVTEHPRSRLSNALKNDSPDHPSYLSGTFKN